jgi:hypothetical protein
VGSLSIITRVHLWSQLTEDLQLGTALLAKLVRFAKLAGGDLRGKIVHRTAMETLVTAQMTGNLQIDIIVQYVMDRWTRGKNLGGYGCQKMWDFQYLCEFTQRLPSSFCNDPKSKEILGRAKYQRGLDHGKSADNNVGDSESGLSCTDKQWKPCTSCNADKQWKPGTSVSKATQWVSGISGSKEMQWTSR